MPQSIFSASMTRRLSASMALQHGRVKPRGHEIHQPLFQVARGVGEVDAARVDEGLDTRLGRRHEALEDVAPVRRSTRSCSR